MKKIFSVLCRALGQEEIKPFLRREAIQFFNLLNVEASLHDMIIDKAGTIPRMLMKYGGVRDISRYYFCTVCMYRDMDDLVDH